MDYITAEEEKEMKKAEEEKELRKEFRKRQLKKKLIKALILFAVVAAVMLVGIGAAWMAGHDQSKDEREELEAEIARLVALLEDIPNLVDPVSPQIILDNVNKEIKEIGELATVEYLFTNAAKYTDSKQIKNWNIPLTEKSFTIKWDGVIKAGVKVEEVMVELNEKDQKIIVTIPAAEILSYDTDEDSVEVLDETDNKFNPITVGDKVKFDAETEKEMKQRAIDNGILEKAQESAKKIINNILTAQTSISDNYVIEYICK